MSQTIDHYNSSVENVKKNYPELYQQEKETIEKLLMDLHEWLDYFYNRKGEDEEGPYDFTGRFVIRHRAKRHHWQGIDKAVVFLRLLCSSKYASIIREEARRHIIDDMGEVLFAEDYRRIGFWKNY
ncbi:MAG: hypothetical protein NTW06_01870 [Candidatus Falkowbacteria bacterium]|nr:hypothetical protein [Candidatus Falkowbacteria bacterium]